MNDLPILDTEEKLRAYLNKIAGCEVDPLTIKAHIFPDRVHLEHTITLQNKEIKHLREECARLEREKQQAYHTGHADGYNAGFAHFMF